MAGCKVIRTFPCFILARGTEGRDLRVNFTRGLIVAYRLPFLHDIARSGQPHCYP